MEVIKYGEIVELDSGQLVSTPTIVRCRCGRPHETNPYGFSECGKCKQEYDGVDPIVPRGYYRNDN